MVGTRRVFVHERNDHLAERRLRERQAYMLQFVDYRIARRSNVLVEPRVPALEHGRLVPFPTHKHVRGVDLAHGEDRVDGAFDCVSSARTHIPHEPDRLWVSAARTIVRHRPIADAVARRAGCGVHGARCHTDRGILRCTTDGAGGLRPHAQIQTIDALCKDGTHNHRRDPRVLRAPRAFLSVRAGRRQHARRIVERRRCTAVLLERADAHPLGLGVQVEMRACLEHEREVNRDARALVLEP